MQNLKGSMMEWCPDVIHLKSLDCKHITSIKIANIQPNFDLITAKSASYGKGVSLFA